MIKGSSILSKLGSKTKSGNGKQKTWIHGPETLTQSFAVYQAKLLGVLTVQESKGVAVVKDATKKLKLAHEISKSEAGHKGSKLPKVEIWVSVDLIKVVHAKTKVVLHQRALHRISYCADDHFETKHFSFIAKNDATGGHECFVFITEREASELTLTVGQAFELAYQRYLQKRGAADLKRSREASMQRDPQPQSFSPPSNGSENHPTVAEEKPAAVTHTALPANQDVFLDFSEPALAPSTGTLAASNSDPFEQYMATVASRGANNDAGRTAPPPMVASTQQQETYTPSSPSNPFRADHLAGRQVAGQAVGSDSPQLPRPKPSGANASPASFPQALLPKPPTKKDIQKSSPALKSHTGSTTSPPVAQAVAEPVVPQSSSNPFAAYTDQRVDLMTDLQTDFGNNLNIRQENTFDPFG